MRGALGALPRVAEILVDLPESDRLFDALRVNDLEADGALIQIRRLVGVRVFLAGLQLWLLMPTVKLANRAERADW